MSRPRTLLEMAGADLTPARLAEAALVLIDCQMEYVDGKIPLTGVAAALAEGGRVLARAREAGTPIIHVVHRGAAGGAFDLAGHGGQVAPQVAPARGETIIEKTLPNSFAGTDLHERLQQTGRKRLIVAGFMTHMCVSSTVRAALDLGYRSTVVASATATRPLPTPEGGTVTAELLQSTALAELADRFATIATEAAGLPD